MGRLTPLYLRLEQEHLLRIWKRESSFASQAGVGRHLEVGGGRDGERFVEQTLGDSRREGEGVKSGG